MNTDHLFDRTSSSKGAFETNLRAREQEKYLNQMEATWLVETRPAAAHGYDRIKAFFARLQASPSMPKRQLVVDSRK